MKKTLFVQELCTVKVVFESHTLQFSTHIRRVKSKSTNIYSIAPNTILDLSKRQFLIETYLRSVPLGIFNEVHSFAGTRCRLVFRNLSGPTSCAAAAVLGRPGRVFWASFPTIASWMAIPQESPMTVRSGVTRMKHILQHFRRNAKLNV